MYTKLILTLITILAITEIMDMLATAYTFNQYCLAQIAKFLSNCLDFVNTIHVL